MSTETVTIIDDATGKEIKLPLYTPTAGPKVIDIGKLYKELGYFTYDPGFISTASPQPSRERILSSRPSISFGYLSQVITICELAS